MKHAWETETDEPSWFCHDCGLEYPTRQLARQCEDWHDDNE